MLRPALALMLAAAALAGCGGSGPSEPEQVRATVTAFGRATARKDYRTLCDRLLAPRLVQKLTEIGLPCERALARGLGDVRDPRLVVGRIVVTGDTASAQVRTSAANQAPSQDTLELVRVRGGWRIASLGSGS